MVPDLRFHALARGFEEHLAINRRDFKVLLHCRTACMISRQNDSSTTPQATRLAAAQRRQRTSSPRMYFASRVSNR
jgi:hypothetical protein